MIAPRGEEYVVETLFQGYVEWGVLDHALFDLSSADIGELEQCRCDPWPG